MPSVAAIINFHDEGLLAGPSLRSALRAADHARAAGLACTLLAVLDSADDTTRKAVGRFQANGVQVLELGLRDVSLARNAGIEAVDADYIAFLDGDDLWDEAWLTEAVKALRAAPPRAIAHPRHSICFGATQEIWIAIDSEDPTFDIEALRVTNYWTALTCAARETYLAFPYAPIDLANGWSYEDWNWNGRTLAAGCRHIAVEAGVHFIRKRPDSLSMASRARDAIVRPSAASLYSFAEGWGAS